MRAAPVAVTRCVHGVAQAGFMKYSFQPLRLREALTVAQWHYPAPYEMYDLARGPLLTSVVMHHLQAPFGRMGFYGVHASIEELVGVFSFQVIQHTVELGLGLRPDLTGQHHGLGFVAAGMEFARAKYAPHQFRLDVAVFNQRAIQVYLRAGFTPGSRFMRYTRLGLHEFMEMTRPA